MTTVRLDRPTAEIAVITLDPGLVFSATIAAATDPADGMPSGHVTTEVPAATCSRTSPKNSSTASPLSGASSATTSAAAARQSEIAASISSGVVWRMSYPGVTSCGEGAVFRRVKAIAT